jgi:hypothetical protein
MITPMNPAELYRREAYTDMQAGVISELTPVVCIDGKTVLDPMREIQYSGETVLMTQAGPQPLQFAIAATSLLEAVERFAPVLQALIEEMQSRAMQQRIANPIPAMNGKQLIIDPQRKRS